MNSVKLAHNRRFLHTAVFQLDLERKFFPAHLPLACTISHDVVTCPATWASEPIQGWKGVLCPHRQHTETFP